MAELVEIAHLGMEEHLALTLKEAYIESDSLSVSQPISQKGGLMSLTIISQVVQPKRSEFA